MYGSSGEDSTTTPNSQDNNDAAYYDYDDIFDELYIDVFSDNPVIEIPLKRRRITYDDGSNDVKPSTSQDESEQKKIDSDDPDVVFFKSLMPEVWRMTQPQKLQFKQSVLTIINNILYVKEEHTEQEAVDSKPEGQ